MDRSWNFHLVSDHLDHTAMSDLGSIHDPVHSCIPGEFFLHILHKTSKTLGHNFIFLYQLNRKRSLGSYMYIPPYILALFFLLLLLLQSRISLPISVSDCHQKICKNEYKVFNWQRYSSAHHESQLLRKYAPYSIRTVNSRRQGNPVAVTATSIEK